MVDWGRRVSWGSVVAGSVVAGELLEEAVGRPIGTDVVCADGLRIGFGEVALSWEPDREMLKSTVLKFTRLIAPGPRSYKQRWNILDAERLRPVATVQVYCVPNVEVETLSVRVVE